MKIHKGVSGIRNINKLLVVTTDLDTFSGPGERNQCFIDGGIFLMSLVLSLSYVGLGSCILNWSVNFNKDILIRKLMKIGKSENIIAFVAVGHLPDKVKVALSIRRKVSEIIKIN